MANIQKFEKGTKFNRLTFIKETRNENYCRWAIFRCDCGVKKELRLFCVKNGVTKSCGCLNDEVRRKIGDRCRTHGLTSTIGKERKLFAVYLGIKERCYNSKCKNYSNYGGKSVKMCDEWKNDPKSFIKWAFENGYKEKLQIDRKDVFGDYEPINCRFVTHIENQNNKREGVFITYKGEKATATSLARKYGFSPQIILNRIVNLKWSVESAFETPVQSQYAKKSKF
jgi:hypothetical protein